MGRKFARHGLNNSWIEGVQQKISDHILNKKKLNLPWTLNELYSAVRELQDIIRLYSD